MLSKIFKNLLILSLLLYQLEANKLDQDQNLTQILHQNTQQEISDVKTIDKFISKEKNDDKWDKLLKDTLYLQVFMIGTIGILYLLPSSVTNWDKDDIGLGDQWLEHVKAGPVWDEDDFFINYIGHPVSGAWYYMVAREDGFGPWGSFGYSFFLSTFFWEYGYEAFAEIPSTQDLIFTPTLGSLMGEGFWILQSKLDHNGGKIFGSKVLGNISYFLLNPIKRITDGISSLFGSTASVHSTNFHPQALLHLNPLLKSKVELPSQYGFMLDIRY